ncbi:hypothetical protein ACFQ1Q_11230 [Winogradskyella litorisediminis]|uniref:Uncharacterized protein n=1 Tax=Winogradskyella litorisediminis TaxID=1156618 RepID=A0ABW3N855_9FLAO
MTSVIFSTQVFSYLLQLKIKIWTAALFSILILALPAFSVYFSWSATAEIPLLLILNFFAGYKLLKAIKVKRKQILNYCLVLCIVLICLFFYQPAAMAFLLPPIILMIFKNEFELNHWVKILFFTMVCFAVYFISFKTMLQAFEIEPSERTTLNLLSLPKKIAKFFFFEIRILLQNSGFLVGSIISFIIGTICFFGFLYVKYFKEKVSLFYIFAAILILPLSYAPNILSSQDYFSMRTIAPTAIIILFYQLYFVQYFIKKESKTKFVIIIPILLLVLSAYNLNSYICNIQAIEYKTLKMNFEKFDIKPNENFSMIRPERNFLEKNEIINRRFSTEFGCLSSVNDWSAPYLFCQLKWENSRNLDKSEEFFSPKNISIYSESEAYKIKPQEKIINLVALFKTSFSVN